MHEIGYSIDISASADVEWETDEQPTGWNYGTDSPTYTTSSYAVHGKIVIHSLVPNEDAPCYYDNEEVSMDFLRQNLPPATQKQLINPEVISGLLDSAFQKQAEKLEPPEPDYDDYEPDDYYDDERY